MAATSGQTFLTQTDNDLLSRISTKARTRHSVAALLIVLVILSILLNLFPQIQNNSMIVAAGMLVGAMEIYGFLRGRSGDDEPAACRGEKSSDPGQAEVRQEATGPHTNIADGVKGSVLSGKFESAVVTGAGGEAVDLRGSNGAMYKPTLQREKLPIPRIPPPPKDFTGRGEELEEILKAFDRGATITGLRGAGGIGKTALALVLADRLRNRFSDGQIILQLKGTSPNPLKPTDAMAQVIRAFAYQ